MPAGAREHESFFSLIESEVLRTHARVRSSGVHRSLVAIAGSVAVGKSTFAGELATRLAAHGHDATVVGTDGFLLPNEILEPRGLTALKGLPDTYDWHAIAAFQRAVRSQVSEVELPSYSHQSFDIVGTHTVSLGDVVIVEGINTMQQPTVDGFDLRVYLDARHDHVAQWYVDRFLGFIRAAESDPTSFYRRFVDQDDPARATTARWVWDTINAPNLREHIEPSRVNADLVVGLDGSHQIVDVATALPDR